MSEKNLKCDKFNNILLSLLGQISQQTKSLTYMKLNTLIICNKNIVIDGFIQYVCSMKEHINNRNEKYFTELNTIEGDQYYCFDEIKTIYLSGDDDTKQTIWNYLQSLLIIAEEYEKL
jgi:hypothetical protein